MVTRLIGGSRRSAPSGRRRVTDAELSDEIDRLLRQDSDISKRAIRRRLRSQGIAVGSERSDLFAELVRARQQRTAANLTANQLAQAQRRSRRRRGGRSAVSRVAGATPAGRVANIAQSLTTGITGQRLDKLAVQHRGIYREIERLRGIDPNISGNQLIKQLRSNRFSASNAVFRDLIRYQRQGSLSFQDLSVTSAGGTRELARDIRTMEGQPGVRAPGEVVQVFFVANVVARIYQHGELVETISRSFELRVVQRLEDINPRLIRERFRRTIVGRLEQAFTGMRDTDIEGLDVEIVQLDVQIGSVRVV